MDFNTLGCYDRFWQLESQISLSLCSLGDSRVHPDHHRPCGGATHEHHNDHRWQPTHQVPTALAATWVIDINIDTGCYRPRHGCRRLVDKVIKIWENVRNQWVSKNYTNNKQWHGIKSLGKSWGTTGIRSFVQGMLISWKLIFSSVWHQECWPKACFVDIKYFVTVVTFIYDLYIMLSFYIHIWYIYLRSIVKTKNNNTYVY